MMRLVTCTATLALLFAFAPVDARAEGARADGSTGTKVKVVKKKAGKKVRRDESSASPSGRTKTARLLRPDALKVTGDHFINDDVQVTPFPSHASAARKALAQNRRDQLIDAEQAARGTGADDRWATVLFHLRALDSRNDNEACFWRSVAYYRLGEVVRAQKTRDLCDSLTTADVATLDSEEAASASLQGPQPLQAFVEAGERPSELVVNQKPYSGPSPVTFKR